MEPELLLLDEPFSALDAFTRASLQKDVRSIAKKQGFNVLMVTHDIDEAVLMADRALVMAGSPGQIIHDLPIDINDPRDRQDPSVQKMRSHLMQIFHDASHSGSEEVYEEVSKEDGGSASNVKSIAS
jgi:NitT/TauT family transport system ATP-binding protein